MGSGLVSVIIPVYNAGGLLERAIRSVQGQTHQQFEIIVVDDGSNDGSLEMARKLAAGEPRIKVDQIAHSGGPARPRNHGIQRASGEFIAYLDQDDQWYPRKLERQVARFRETDCAVVYSDAVFVDELSPQKRLLVTELPAHRERYGHVDGGLPRGQVQRELIMGNFAAQLTVVIRADWVRKAGKMDERAVGVDCYEYLLRIALAGGEFEAVHEPLAVHYRGSLSRDQEIAQAHTLRFFRDFAPRFPQYREHWTFRIRDYEGALIARRLEWIADRSLPLTERLSRFYDLLWLHPRRGQVTRAAKALLPPAIRRSLRGIFGRIIGRNRSASRSR